MRSAKGFTLIELMVVVVVVATLATIAIPSYSRYIQRGDLVEATNALAQYRVQMEQYYQDNANYGTAPGCGVAYPTLVNFAVTCVGATQSYTATATANAGGPVAGFSYTIDNNNNQATPTAPTGWSTSATSWVVR